MVENVTADVITIMDDEGQRDTYILRKFERTNQGTNYNQTPLVSMGERVEAGQVLADGPGTHNGEMSSAATCWLPSCRGKATTTRTPSSSTSASWKRTS